MKYPILHLNYVPELHKAFSKPVVLHFHGTCNSNEMTSYMNYLLKTASIQFAQQFLSCQAVVVEVENNYYILCKDNIDERMMKRFANEMLSLLKENGNDQISFTFGYTKAMLEVDGHSIGILNSNKVGDPYLESEDYKKSLTLVKGDAKNSFLFMLNTMEEFQNKHEKKD